MTQTLTIAHPGATNPHLINRSASDRLENSQTSNRDPLPQPAKTRLRNTNAILNRAMHQADDYVVSLEYLDSKGQKTRRVMSPIRFVGKNRVLGLCLGRCEPRQFYLDRCQNITLHHANQFVMPVPIEVLAN